jgi:hypothetical protein
VKLGPRIEWKEMLFVPYVVADWIYAPRYPERWFENRFAAGGGLRWHPFVTADRKTKLGDLLARFHIFGEIVWAKWLGNDPPAVVRDYDIRLGISFSTGGFFREKP